MAKSLENYHEQQKKEYIERLRELQKDLPHFVEEFFRGAGNLSSNKTKVAYAYDLRVFFTYICENCKLFENKQIKDLELSDLELITPENIDMFLEYISYYENSELSKQYLNSDRTKARKCSAIRSMYTFFYKKQKIKYNPSDFVIAPKLHEKNIIKLEVDEVARLLDQVESGELLTDKQKEYHEHTQKRDLALISLLLGTGIRVSECIGINIGDVDFDLNGIKIVRKGGNESTVYFGGEVRESLLDYLETREYSPEDALFLSMQKKRMNVRSVQKLVKKYAALVTSLKNITPHKLRSTYGTNLYNESGDIYLVADALGHRDVNTTKKHYAKIDEQNRKSASKYIKLRK